MNEKIYAEIVISKNVKQVDQLYTYEIPETLREIIEIGSKVIIPFGRGSSLYEGYVFNICKECSYDRLKKIESVVQDGVQLSKKQIEFCYWLKKEYLCTYTEAIRKIIPVGTKLKKRRLYSINNTIDQLGASLTDKHVMLLKQISTKKCSYRDLIRKYSATVNDIKHLLKENLITEHVEFYNDVTIKYIEYVQWDSRNNPEEIINSIPKNYTRQRNLINLFIERNIWTYSDIRNSISVDRKTVDKFAKQGVLKWRKEKAFRFPKEYLGIESDTPKTLNAEQKQVFDHVNNAISQEAFGKFLLHGVTGSGKTEVYMQLVAKVLNKHQEAIILVPEISLTPQIVKKFIARFGDQVAILHSKLTLGEQFDQWREIKEGNYPIIIGARSAIFAPVNNLGLIIIDESHENTYKANQTPKYTTKEVAEYLCDKHNSVLLLGTATPSVENYHNTKSDYKLLTIKNRFDFSPMPPIETIDMREELVCGNKTMFSRRLFTEMEHALSENQQIILFLNRRGHSTFVSCRSCGYSLKCPNCDVSLTFHNRGNYADCSYCGLKMKVPHKCPDCQSKYFKYFGAGTEKVEQFTKKMFPKANIARLDSVVNSKKGYLLDVINGFEDKKYDILIGTQMVTKGLDFNNVGLVGVISADVILNLPFYTSNERTYQLLTQVAGRAGRGNKHGRVIVQTYTPDHFVINSVRNYAYDDFLKEELALRKSYGYPPYKQIVNLTFVGKNRYEVKKSATKTYNQLKRYFSSINFNDYESLDAHPASYERIKNKFRWQIVLKYNKIDKNVVSDVIKEVCVRSHSDNIMKDVYLSIDLNAINVM